VIIETLRLRLRTWHKEDRKVLAELHADPEVMLDYGGVISSAQSDAKLDRYAAAFDTHGFGRWVVESHQGAFLGYTGVMPSWPRHPLGPHFEIGWRLARSAWGNGFATEAASAALHDVFQRAGLREVLAYTSADNKRSQAVMNRLRLRREPNRDFTAAYDGIAQWTGLVWIAEPVRQSGVA
jgi:RimJ/RimL family protein N-acetyltransferase